MVTLTPSSAVAWSSASLIAFRALQGAGGALFAPAGLSLLMTTFADGRGDLIWAKTSAGREGHGHLIPIPSASCRAR